IRRCQLMLAKYKRSIGALVALSAIGWGGGVVSAQTLNAVVTKSPTGPNTPVEVTLSYDAGENGPEVLHGMHFSVIYNNALVELNSAEDLDGGSDVLNLEPTEHTDIATAFGGPTWAPGTAGFNAYKVVLGTLGP